MKLQNSCATAVSWTERCHTVQLIDFAFKFHRRATVCSTSFWPAENRWQGSDYAFAIAS